jgi:RNA polymerase sigma factor (sigma-70 family)
VKPFERVVDEHGPTVLRVCRALLGPADADDAWSETFLAALRAYTELPADANVEAWLVTIARRKAIDQLRARRRRALPVAELPEPATDGHATEGHAPEETDALWQALRSLTTRQREAIAYHHLVGLPYAEVAALVGGSAAAARRAAADGMKTLRTLLEESP